LLLKQADPTGILTSAPGVAAITAAAILGRLSAYYLICRSPYDLTCRSAS
jgi:hypothetical protein